MNTNYCILSEDTSDNNFIKVRLNCFIYIRTLLIIFRSSIAITCIIY